MSDEHSKKAPFPIITIDEGNVINICFNFEQPLKARDPIVVIEVGIFIFIKFEHS